MLSELDGLRKKIDKIDKEIVEKLAGRFFLTEKVGEYKKRKKLKPYDRKRESEMIERRISWGNDHGLEEGMVKNIFRMITKISKRRHRRIINGK